MLHRLGNLGDPRDDTKNQQDECIIECMVYVLTGEAWHDLESCDYYCRFLHHTCLEAAGCEGNKLHPPEKNDPKYWADNADDY